MPSSKEKINSAKWLGDLCGISHGEPQNDYKKRMSDRVEQNSYLKGLSVKIENGRASCPRCGQFLKKCSQAKIK